MQKKCETDLGREDSAMIEAKLDSLRDFLHRQLFAVWFNLVQCDHELFRCQWGHTAMQEAVKGSLDANLRQDDHVR